MLTTNDIISQAIFAIGAILGAIGAQQKAKKNILIFFSASTFVASISFVFLEAYPGALSLFMMAVFGIINYKFDEKEKKIPIVILAIFIAIVVGLGVITFATITDALPIIAAVCYIFAMTQQKENRVRLFTISNLSLFVAYDLITTAYVASLTDGIFAISTIIAIARYDIVPMFKKAE